MRVLVVMALMACGADEPSSPVVEAPVAEATPAADAADEKEAAEASTEAEGLTAEWSHFGEAFGLTESTRSCAGRSGKIS